MVIRLAIKVTFEHQSPGEDGEEGDAGRSTSGSLQSLGAILRIATFGSLIICEV